MEPPETRELRRRALLGSAVVIVASLSGCLTAVTRPIHDFGFLQPPIASRLSFTHDEPLVSGQPTAEEGVPAAFGAVAPTPSAVRELVEWSAIPTGATAGVPATDFREFDPEKYCVTVVVGVLPYGYALTGVREDKSDVYWEDGRVRFEVEPYRAFQPSPGESHPSFSYDYTITLWRLERYDAPVSVVVNLHDSTITALMTDE
jgi:hypothetical protein